MNYSKKFLFVAVFFSAFLLWSGLAFAAAKPAATGQSEVVPHGPTVFIKADNVGPCAVGDLCQLRAVVTDDKGAPVANARVIFKIYDFSDNATTDASGVAKMGFAEVLDAMVIGNNPYEARIDTSRQFGNGLPGSAVTYNPASQLKSTGTIQLTKGTCQFNFDVKNGDYQIPRPPVSAPDGNKLRVARFSKLETKFRSIPHRKVRIVFSGKTYELSTSQRTQFSGTSNNGLQAFGGAISIDIPLKISDLGKTLPLEGFFDGDSVISACSTKVDVRLDGLLPTQFGYSVKGALADSPKIQFGESVDIKVHIHNGASKPAPLPNTPFFLVARIPYHPDHMYLGKGVTDANGNATVHYTHTNPVEPTKDDWPYNMVVAYNNNGTEYDSSTPPAPGDVRGKLIVIPANLDAAVTAPSSATPGEEVTVKFKITNPKNHTPVAIQMRLFGVEDADMLSGSSVFSSDNQGVATCKFKMSSKEGLTKQDFSIQIWDSKKYYWFNKSFSIPVSKGRVNPRAGGPVEQQKINTSSSQKSGLPAKSGK